MAWGAWRRDDCQMRDDSIRAAAARTPSGHKYRVVMSIGSELRDDIEGVAENLHITMSRVAIAAIWYAAECDRLVLCWNARSLDPDWMCRTPVSAAISELLAQHIEAEWHAAIQEQRRRVSLDVRDEYERMLTIAESKGAYLPILRPTT